MLGRGKAQGRGHRENGARTSVPDSYRGGQAAPEQDQAAARIQGRGLGKRHPRRPRVARGRQGHGFRQFAVRRGKDLCGARQGRQTRGEDHRGKAVPAERHRIPQRLPLRRRDKAAKYQRCYALFGLIPDDLDLYQSYLDLYGSSIAGFYHPKTKELWFGDNQRDWLAEDMPVDEVNRVTKPGQHFGFPYCHSGLMTDPLHGWGKDCKNYVKPALLIGPHAAPLGMRFYTGKMFPAKYQNAIFLTRHGPWNRTEKYAADVVAIFIDDKGNAKMEPFLTGLVENNGYLGRPADVMVMKDGSLLVSDDHNGAIYRISYGK
ncbi:MAG: PQQ-dependent sugar dehydrogenase [Betaproteobacteria bacterium]|nr:PQQ-dependent sugar dehydrogenase [Betaproteobacteria bacterium]